MKGNKHTISQERFSLFFTIGVTCLTHFIELGTIWIRCRQVKTSTQSTNSSRYRRQSSYSATYRIMLAGFDIFNVTLTTLFPWQPYVNFHKICSYFDEFTGKTGKLAKTFPCQGSCSKTQAILFAHVVNLIPDSKGKTIQFFIFFKKAVYICQVSFVYVIVTNHVNWHRENLRSDREKTGKTQGI